MAERELRTSERRRRILEAARDLFTEGGEAAVAIDAVAGRSGASVGSIYHHFGSKEGLLAGAWRAAMEDYRTGLWDRLAAAAGPEESVKALVRHHLAWIADHPGEARLLHEARGSAAVRGARQPAEDAAHFARLWEHFRPFLEAGQMVRLPPALYPPLLLGPAHELARQWIRGRGDLDLREAAEHLAEAAWRSLRA